MNVEKRNRATQTSADMIMPLPLTESEINALTDSNYTTEINSGVGIDGYLPDTSSTPENQSDRGTMSNGDSRLRPGGFFPIGNRPNITIIPIIPGITQVGYIRFLNANPSIGPVDIYVNGRRIATSLNYRAFTEYMKTLPGYYRVAVFKAGTRQNPINVTRINIIPNRIYTAALTGTADRTSLQLITDNQRNLNPNRAFVRFIQLSPNAPLMDVYIDDRLVLTDLDYQEVSRYLSVAPGKHNLKLKVSVSSRTLLEDPDMTLRGGKAYSVYVVGNMEERPGLQVLIPLEGTSYLTF